MSSCICLHGSAATFTYSPEVPGHRRFAFVYICKRSNVYVYTAASPAALKPSQVPNKLKFVYLHIWPHTCANIYIHTHTHAHTHTHTQKCTIAQTHTHTLTFSKVVPADTPGVLHQQTMRSRFKASSRHEVFCPHQSLQAQQDYQQHAQMPDSSFQVLQCVAFINTHTHIHTYTRTHVHTTLIRTTFVFR